MNISYNWLKKYFDEEIPNPKNLAEILSLRMFEVESVVEQNNDFALDIKVLPDRAHHALSHRGVVREVSAVTGIPIKKIETKKIVESSDVSKVEVQSESNLCRRYIARRIENVKITLSPKWLTERLESIGARSINNIVDATNFTMFDLGQPLHAFDADKISGAIKIRLAENGEKMTLLDGREVTLIDTDMLIADDVGPLVIAGVKGGKRAEVTEETKNIIIESANFDPVAIRRTSTRLDLRNDSSKRFENEISSELAGEAMDAVCSLISDLCPRAKFGILTDVYNNPVVARKIICSPKYISEIIGLEIDKVEIISILQKIGADVAEDGDNIIVTPPYYRLDLNIPEDLVDEVGRIYGYEKLPTVLPPELSTTEPVDKTFFYSEKVKNILVARGFSETILYSLVAHGFFEVALPLASDKSFLRDSLKGKMLEALAQNTRNAPLLDLETIKIFEIGNVFPKSGEQTNICLAVCQIKKKKGVSAAGILEEELKNLQKEISIEFEYKIESGDFGAICEIDFSKIVAKLV
jgi:phenylalanyl-tRNA synthetase beta chain